MTEDDKSRSERFEDLASKMLSFTKEQVEKVKKKAEELASEVSPEERLEPEE